MFGNYTALKFISHTHLSTSIYTYPSQFSAIEFKRKRYGWTKEISNYISFFFNYCYLGVLSSLTFTLSVTSITLLKPKQRPSVLTWPKQNIVCPSLSKNNVCAYWTCYSMLYWYVVCGSYQLWSTVVDRGGFFFCCCCCCLFNSSLLLIIINE